MNAQMAMFRKANRYWANQIQDAQFNKKLAQDAGVTRKFDWINYFKESAQTILG